MSKYLQQFETFDTFLKNIPTNLNISYLEDGDTFIFGLIGSDNLIIYENETKLNNMTGAYDSNGIYSSNLERNEYLDSYSIGILSFTDINNYNNIRFAANIYKLYFNDPYILSRLRYILGDYYFYNIGEIELGDKVIIQNSQNILHKNSQSDTDIYNCIIDENNPNIDSRDNCNAIIETSTNTLSTGFINTTIPNSVVSIGSNAFAYTNKLYIITIPSSVTSIGTQAFYYCKDLHYIIIESTTPPTVTNNPFGSCANYMKIFVPDASVNTYKNDANWSTYSDRIYSINDIGKFIYYYGSSKLPETTSSKNSGIHTTAFPTITNHSYDSDNQCGCIEFESSVETIGNYGFFECGGICNKIILPPTITGFGNWVFGNNSSNSSTHDIILTNHNIFNDNFTYYNFSNGSFCYNMKPNWDFIIGPINYTSSTCPEKLFIPHSVKIIYNLTLYDSASANKLKFIKIHSGVEFITYNFCGYSYYNNGTTTYNYAKGIKCKNSIYYIDGYAISCPFELQHDPVIDIWEGIHTIAQGFLYNISSNAEYLLIIPSTVKNICISDANIYNNTTGINGVEYIEIDSNNTTYDSRNNCNAIIETATNKLIVGCKNSTIPNTITSIGRYAFYNCTKLIGTLTLPNGITSIGNYAFYSCTGLTSVTIGNGVTSIGGWAFQFCTGLTSVTIGNSITSIGNHAFYGCSGLTSITIEAITPPSMDGYDCFNSTNNCPIYVPSSSVEAYKAATYWSNYASRIQAIPT